MLVLPGQGWWGPGRSKEELGVSEPLLPDSAVSLLTLLLHGLRTNINLETHQLALSLFLHPAGLEKALGWGWEEAKRMWHKRLLCCPSTLLTLVAPGHLRHREWDSRRLTRWLKSSLCSRMICLGQWHPSGTGPMGKQTTWWGASN